jgi:glycosyltransferase involved in cell wall biosynthesis
LARVVLLTSMASTVVNFRGPLIVELVGRGDTVQALAPDWTEELKQDAMALGAEPIDISLSRTGVGIIRDVIDAAALFKLFRQLKPTSLLSYFAKPVIYGTIAARFAGVPRRVAMIEGLGYAFTSSARPGTRRRVLKVVMTLMYAASLRLANTTIFLNRDDLDYFKSRRLVDFRKAIILGGIGVDLADFVPTAENSGRMTFVMVARLLREKGVAEFAEAARLIKQQQPQVEFLLLGDLDDNPGSLAKDEVEAWTSSGVLTWKGHVKDVKPYLAQSSVFVLPSYREGVPRSTQEAMAMGKPVITTDAVGCRDTIIDGQNGFLVPVRDAPRLAAAMSRFIADPTLISIMGRASRKLAEERFDVRRANARLLAIIDGTPDPHCPYTTR